MPKATKENIREIKLHPDAESAINAVIKHAKKLDVGDEKKVMELFYEQFEGDRRLSKALRARGVDDRYAQLQAIDSTKSNLGRVLTKPKYRVIILPSNITTATKADEKIKGKTYEIMNVGGAIRVFNIKTNLPIGDEKLAVITAYRDDVKKLETLDEGVVSEIEACAYSVDGNFLQMSLDDRCTTAKESNKTMTPVETLLLKLYDITPIVDAGIRVSENRKDFRLIEGRINWIKPIKDRDFSRVELTDSSVSLIDIDKKKNDANLVMMIYNEIISQYGRESVIRALAAITQKKDPQYGIQTTFSFPSIVVPMLLVEPEIEEADDDEEVADPDEYINKIKEEKYADLIDDDEEEKESTDDPPEPEPEDPEQVPEPEPEPEPEQKPKPTKKGKPKKEKDPYAKFKDHPCMESGDFGMPDDKDDPDYEAGCGECEKTEPDAFKACHEKAKKEGNI